MADLLDCLTVKTILLGIVNDIPEPPTLNIPQKHKFLERGRALSFKHEVCIAQQLAYVCAYSSDPLHVLAVCVEETASRNGMIIRFAANTGNHEALVDGLQNIARILQNEAKNGSSSLEHKPLIADVILQ